MAVPIEKRYFDVDEYYRMLYAGILSVDDRVELIEGEIVKMSPIGARHAGCVKRLHRLLNRLVGDSAIIGVQDPVRLSRHSEPQPDIALLRPRADFYASSHPTPADVLLIVEVAETSTGYDRAVKLPLYASVGIPQVWLVDLAAQSVEVYTEPTPGGYATQMVMQGSDVLLVPGVSAASLRVSDILPPEA